eukprot:SAG31_NODE_4498_length_3185_cov_36.595269_2_plen_81_part_00
MMRSRSRAGTQGTRKAVPRRKDDDEIAQEWAQIKPGASGMFHDSIEVSVRERLAEKLAQKNDTRGALVQLLAAGRLENRE